MERVGLNTLFNIKGAHKQAVRVGRGRSSRRPRTAGRGMIGQKQRTTVSPSQNGGQTPIYFLVPKHGMTRRQPKYEFAPLNLWKLQEYVQQGRIDSSKVIDQKALADCKIVGKIEDGVKLLAGGAKDFTVPLHLRVSQASKAAIAAVEKAGGSVECVYYNRVGMQALLKPEKFIELPRPGLPRHALRKWYENPENRGFLSKTTAKAALESLHQRALAENAATVAGRTRAKESVSASPATTAPAAAVELPTSTPSSPA